MECLTTATFSILVNRIPWNFFKPNRGLRQGDPISPYIFIICAKYLGRYIYHRASIPKTGMGVKVAKQGPMILFLMFADDCIIFSKASKMAARNVKEVLQDYCMVSSQLVNYHKSLVQFSKGSNRTTRMAIIDTLQIPQSNRLEAILDAEILTIKERAMIRISLRISWILS